MPRSIKEHCHEDFRTPHTNREWDKNEIKKKTDKMLEDHGTKVLDLEWPALVTWFRVLSAILLRFRIALCKTVLYNHRAIYNVLE